MDVNRVIFRISVIVIFIIYAVGLAGFLSVLKDQMIALTPYTLLLSLFLLLINQREWARFLFLFMVTVMLAGFFVEVFGVKTGILFGQYQYGRALGWKQFDVPLLIGVNWFILTFSTGMTAGLLRINRFLQAVFAAALMVAMDFVLEPVAMAYDFWSWEGDMVPLRNYFSWFIISLIFQVLFQGLRLKQINRFAIILFIVQLIFFMTLSLALYI
jgi:bisanhydrobacterioruberin hydratase